MTSKILNVIGQNRSCGSCTACCEALAIQLPWGDKPQYKPCEKLKQGSNKACGVYDERPEVCVRFRCLWLEGLGDNKDRPDKSGLVLNIQQTGLPVPLDVAAKVPGALGKALREAPGLAVQAIEVWKDAHKTSGLHLFRDIGEHAPIFVLKKDGSRTMRGPPAWCQAVLEQVAEEDAKAKP